MMLIAVSRGLWWKAHLQLHKHKAAEKMSPLNIEIAPYTSRIVQQLSTTATSVDTEFSMTNNTLIAPKRTATPTAANSNHQLQQYIPRETRSLQPHLLLSRFPKQQTYQIVIYYLQHASLEFMSNRAFSCDVITFEITKENGKQLPCWYTTR